MRFVLVHGGFHGAWCWEPMIIELQGAGHTAVAPDLPGHGARVAERATLEGYRDAVVEVLRDGDVLVGHSMGGYVTSIAADAFGDSLSHLVYLAAGVPVEGEAMGATHSVDVAGTSRYYEVSEGPHGPEMTFSSYEGARDHFFHDCDEATARAAFARLTPQQIGPTETPIEMRSFWELDTPRTLIACLDDRSGINYYHESSLRRLGLTNAHLLWASHSPFLSRPADMARVLVAIATESVPSSRSYR